MLSVLQHPCSSSTSYRRFNGATRSFINQTLHIALIYHLTFTILSIHENRCLARRLLSKLCTSPGLGYARCQTVLQCRTVFRCDDDESEVKRGNSTHRLWPLRLVEYLLHPHPPHALNTAPLTPRTARRLGRSLRQDPFIQAIYNNALHTSNDTHTPTDTTQHTSPIEMETERHHNISELQGANYAPWYLSIKTYAATIEASDHLIGNPLRPDTNPQLKAYEKSQNRLLSAVMSGVPMDILGLLLVPQETTTPMISYNK